MFRALTDMTFPRKAELGVSVILRLHFKGSQHVLQFSKVRSAKNAIPRLCFEATVELGR